MKPEQVFKRYDIRGKVPEEIDQEFAEKLGKALGTFLRQNYGEYAVVGRDNKNSSENLKQKLVKGLKTTGITVLDTGTGTTDLLSLACSESDSPGVQVTSSHLKCENNGFKLLYPEGNGFLNEDLYEVQDIFRGGEFMEEEGEHRAVSDRINRLYVDRVKKFLSENDLEIDRKIVFDSMGGTSEKLLRKILDDLDAEYEKIENEELRDPPNPKPENLEELREKVSEDEIGFANDLDADRVTVYYDGKFLTGDEVFGLLSQVFDGDSVSSVDLVETVAETLGDEVHYTRVGDPFVMDEAIRKQVSLAGEPNGHYAFPSFVPYNSGILAGLILASIDLDSLLDKLPDFSVEKTAVKTERKEEKMEILREELNSSMIVSEVDGVKFVREESTVLARASGTSSKIRIKADSSSPEDSSKAVDWTERILQNG